MSPLLPNVRPPGGEVYLDGHFVDTAPDSRAGPGEHVVEFRKNAYTGVSIKDLREVLERSRPREKAKGNGANLRAQRGARVFEANKLAPRAIIRS